MRERLTALIAAILLLCGTACDAGIPDLGAHVYRFNPRMPLGRIQAAADLIAKHQIDSQFGSGRYALLFEPGVYGSREHPLHIQVGYYTSVAGLGESPEDVVIIGTIQVRNRCFKGACVALDNFWRSLSNLTIDVASNAAGCDADEIWAVSQAAPVRRVHVKGADFKLSDGCTLPSFSSGGFIADSQFDGAVQNGTQQQFMIRNSQLHGWQGGSWNQVFSGVTGAPARCLPAAGACGPYTTLATSGATREAPFLYLDTSHSYQVWVPAARRDTTGTTWAAGQTPGVPISLATFHVAGPHDTAATLNAALRAGKNLLLTPAVYHLHHSIVIRRPGTLVLGLGFPTLVPENGITALSVTASKGVAISGILVDAGPVNSAALLTVGLRGAAEDDSADDPTVLHDVFFRIGGAGAGRATVSLIVDADHVILDHIWAWRADHGTGVGWTRNTADSGVVVNGQDVTAYGLFVEHFQGHEVLWNGENGHVIFFQNEMPYDPPNQAAWRESPGRDGYPALEVSRTVRRFSGVAMGSYSYFNQGAPIYAANAFSVPPTLAPGSLRNVFSLFLNAVASGGIRRVVNDRGGASTAVNPDIPVRVERYP